MSVQISEQDLHAVFKEKIAESAANDLPLQIVGGGSKAFYGNASKGEILEVAGHSGIIDYDPAELVITLRGGCKLVDVEALLAEHGQMFGFEPPHFSEQATIGGMVASGLAGPRRAFAGGIRDYILGVKILDGRGEVLNFGGRVIKNVAGFDVSRLMVGAMGTLGVLLEVSLRVIPCFETETTLCFEHDNAEQHIEWINELGGKPLPISASLWHKGQSQIRLSGSQQGVDSAVKNLGGETCDSPWSDMCELTHEFFKDQSKINRISIAPTREFSLERDQMIEWGGAQRWITGDCDIARMRERLQDKQGSLCLFHSDHSEPVFQLIDEASLVLHRSLKSKFDPARIFNRDRLYPGL
jgi:glycolate oxidase FAD binding subunit